MYYIRSVETAQRAKVSIEDAPKHCQIQSGTKMLAICNFIYSSRCQYGFQNIQQNTKEVEAALADIQCIREAISDLASTEDTALLKSVASSSISYKSEDDPNKDKELPHLNHVTIREIVESVEDFQELLQKCNYNWLEFIVCLEEQLFPVSQILSLMPLPHMAIQTNMNKELLHQSYVALFSCRRQ